MMPLPVQDNNSVNAILYLPRQGKAPVPCPTIVCLSLPIFRCCTAGRHLEPKLTVRVFMQASLQQVNKAKRLGRHSWLV